MVTPASLRRNDSISDNVDEKLSFVNPSICFLTVAIYNMKFGFELNQREKSLTVTVSDIK
jgi:hypothetical protein